jgi:hypothetical protein
LFSIKTGEVFGKALLDEGGSKVISRKGAKGAKNWFVFIQAGEGGTGY